jgi:hypothetical protein
LTSAYQSALQLGTRYASETTGGGGRLPKRSGPINGGCA